MGAGLGFPGRDVIVKLNGVAIAGVREKSVAMNKEPIDVSADDSAGWRELLKEPGQRQLDLSVSGVTKSATLRTLVFSANDDDNIQPLTLEYPDGGIIAGDFYIATYTETGTYNDSTTFESS